jgi:hypothetical protein
VKGWHSILRSPGIPVLDGQRWHGVRRHLALVAQERSACPPKHELLASLRWRRALLAAVLPCAVDGHRIARRPPSEGSRTAARHRGSARIDDRLGARRTAAQCRRPWIWDSCTACTAQVEAFSRRDTSRWWLSHLRGTRGDISIACAPSGCAYPCPSRQRNAVFERVETVDHWLQMSAAASSQPPLC